MKPRQSYHIEYRVSDGLTHSLQWTPGRPLSLGFPVRHVLDMTGEQLVLVDLQTRTMKVSKDLVSGELKSGDVSLKFRRLERLPEVDLVALKEGRYTKYTLPQELEKDLDGASFDKLLKQTVGAGVALLALLVAIPTLMGSGEEEGPAEGDMVSLSVDAGAAAGYMAAAYSDALNSGQAVEQAAQAAAEDKAHPEKGLRKAFASLFKGGMAALTSVPNQAGMGGGTGGADALTNVSTGGGSPDGAVGGKGSGLVKVSVGGGGGGYGRGGGGGGGGIAGQGQGVLNLNIADAEVDEGLSKDEVGKVIHQHISEIRYCYESSMIRSPDIEGKLVIDFVIGGRGAIRTAKVKESSVRDSRLDECILSRLAKWEFPKPKAGVDVAVSYPFIFKKLRR
jgi:TonB family protein